jgi:hypothetical protein
LVLLTSRHGLTCRLTVSWAPVLHYTSRATRAFRHMTLEVGTNTHLGSYSQGRASAMMRMTSSRSSTDRPIGPSVLIMPS